MPMQTLVYAPEVSAHIYSRLLDTTIDVSKDIVRGSVTRVVDSCSDFALTLRNDQGQYNKILSRNDRIIIWLKKTKWVQVFSGYLTEVPYLDVYPTDCEIKGLCTIKRIRDYFWDPGLAKNQLLLDPGSDEGTDGGATTVLTNLLTEKVAFSADSADGKHNRILIQKIPENYIEMARNYLVSSNPGEIETLLLEWLGGGVAGGGDGSTGGGSGGSNASGEGAARILSVASAEVGTKADASNRQKYGEWFGWNGVAWCAQFVSWCANQAGFGEDVLPKTAAVATLRNFFQTHNQITQTPVPGDIFMVMPDQHTGLVEDVLPSGFVALEGNTGNQDVARTTYSNSGNIMFGHPNYPGGEGSSGSSGSEDKDKDSGSQGQAWLQTPLKVVADKTIGFGGSEGCYTVYGHRGMDFITQQGQEVVALADGTVKRVDTPAAYGNRVIISHDSGMFTIYANLASPVAVAEGDKVKQGDKVGTVGSEKGVHIEVWDKFEPDTTGDELDPKDYLGKVNKNSSESSSGGSQDSVVPTLGDVKNQAALQIFNALFHDFKADAESTQLVGERARMNDESLLNTVRQYVQAGLRRFQSSPTGDFLAFFPDYFGDFDTAPVLKLADVEMIDVKVRLSDTDYTSHVFAITDDDMSRSIDLSDKLNTGGVVSLDMEYVWTKIVPNHPEGYDSADAMMKTMGIRPLVESYPGVNNRIFGWMLAAQTFQKKWAQQFLTTVTFTFMPELFPGTRIELADHGISVYVDSVSHTFDYTTGFRTTARISCPVIKDSDLVD